MNKLLTITILCMFLTIGSVMAAADFTYDLNFTQLPANMSEYISMVYSVNKTLNLTYGDYMTGSTDFLNYSNPSTCTAFDDRNGTAGCLNFETLIYVPQEVGIGNFSDYITLFNSEDNFTANVSFDFHILDDRNMTPIPNATTDFVQVDINSYEYTVCDYMLPWNRTKEIVVKGNRPGQTFYTDADPLWITVPPTVVIPDVNYSVVPVVLKIQNVSVGTYTKILKFSVVSQYSNVTFRFVVQQCVQPPPSYDEMVKVCSIVTKTPEQVVECQKLQAEYQQKLYEAMLSTREKYTTTNETVKYVNVTERVPVLDLKDDSVIQALKDIPITWNQMIVDSRAKQKQIDDLASEVASLRSGYNNELKTLRDETAQELQDNLKSLVTDNMVKENTINIYKDKYLKKSTMIWWGIFIAMIGGCVFWFIKWNEDNLW